MVHADITAARWRAGAVDRSRNIPKVTGCIGMPGQRHKARP